MVAMVSELELIVLVIASQSLATYLYTLWFLIGDRQLQNIYPWLKFNLVDWVSKYFGIGCKALTSFTGKQFIYIRWR